MDSLYGGRPGTSFVIKASFKSVAEMRSKFALGPNYTDCWYGEFCIIDCDNKNDKTNGQIYQRGLDYQAKDDKGNQTGGAIYVGQVVGPSSGTPYFQLASLQTIQGLAQAASGNDYTSYKRYPTGIDESVIGPDGKPLGIYKTNTDSGEDGKNLFVDAFGDSETEKQSLVPGKYQDSEGNIKYNDTIKYSWLNLRLDNADADSWFYVGFEIPYLITDYSIHMTSPYDANGNILTDATEVSRIDNGEHPFYSHWDLGIPKGVKGDTIRNLRVIVPTTATKIYDINALNIDNKSGEATVNTSVEYANKEDDIAHNRQIVVFDYYIYDKLRNPIPYTFYIGNFNIISDIKVEDDGTLVVSYTHDDDTVFVQRIRWIDQINLTEGDGKQGGHFTFTYNVDVDPTAENPVKETKEFDVSWIKGLEIEQDGSLVYTYAGTPDRLPDGAHTAADLTAGRYRVDDFLQWIGAVNLNNQTGQFTVTNNRNEQIFNTVLDWIRDIRLDDDGTLHFIHTDTSVGLNGDVVYNKEIKYVSTVSLSQDNGQFQMNFNTGDVYNVQLDWIDNIYIDENNGEIAIHHTNNALNTSGATTTRPAAQVLTGGKLKLITRAEVSSDGIVTFITNTGENIVIKNQGLETDFHLQYITNVSLSDDIEKDKHIFIKYNTKDTAEPIGDSINFVKDMVVRPEDYHLLVLFSDPEHRFDATQNTLDENGQYQGITWVNNITGSDGTKYDPSVFWRDYGTIKDQSGVLIGFNLTRADIGENTDILDYLNENFPIGLTGANNQPGGANTKEKIITFAESDTDDKEFYAYDYNEGHWYYLGRIADNGMRDAELVFTEGNDNKPILNAIKDINSKGVLLIGKKSVTYSDNGMPLFWDSQYDWTIS